MIENTKQESPAMAVRKNRPILVWIITFYYAIAVLMVGFGLIGILVGNLPHQTVQHIFANMTPLDYTASPIIALCNLGGAISLFRLRKLALPLFVVAFGIALAMTFWQTVGRGAPAAMGGLRILSLFVPIAVILYTAHLSNKRALT
jgi:hypothetical protein